MPDPLMDLEKLKAIRDWSQDLADELTLRSDLLPCKNLDRGDCISLQSRRLIEEMKPSKMCLRCQARWYVIRGAKIISDVYEAKTSPDRNSKPDFT